MRDTILQLILCIAYWDSNDNDPQFTDYSTPFHLPASLLGGHSLGEKIAELLVKDPDERKTVKKFSSHAFFKDVVITKDFQNAQLNELIHGQNKIIDIQQEMLKKIDNILYNVMQFLPAIQDNLISMMASSELPNRFILLPVHNKFEKITKNFYSKFKLYFICDCGGHIAKCSEKDGYEMLQITSLGKSILMISQILITVAIKVLG